MEGQFEFTSELLHSMNLTEMEVVNMMLDQQLRKADISEKERLITGWYARRIHPVTGNRVYKWDSNIHHKISRPHYIEYLDSLKSDGWEIVFNYKN